MKEEIKEILDDINNWIDSPRLDEIDKKYAGWELSYNQLKILLDYITNLQEENERLKYWLNDVIFDEDNIDVELPARYLRKLGYIDFDDKKKVYINKHNNSPFMQEDSKEKSFYLKDEELNEYTQQLESQNKDYKSRIDKAIEYIKQHCEIVRFEDKGVDMIGKVEGIPLLNILQGEDK